MASRGWLVAGLALWRPGFDPRFLWKSKWKWERFSSDYFGFPLSVSFHLCSIFIYLSYTTHGIISATDRKLPLVGAEENFISSEWKLYSQNLRPKQTPASHLNVVKLENERYFLRKSKDGILRNADTHLLYEISVPEEKTLLGMATSELTWRCLSWGGPCLRITKHFISGCFLWWLLWYAANWW